MSEVSAAKLVHLFYKVFTESIFYDFICRSEIRHSIRHIVGIGSQKLDQAGIKKRERFSSAQNSIKIACINLHINTVFSQAVKDLQAL